MNDSKVDVLLIDGSWFRSADFIKTNESTITIRTMDEKTIVIPNSSILYVVLLENEEN